ncbi:MAG: hypothetical protein AB7O88_15520 [Reyranellaceae bacterium]
MLMRRMAAMSAALVLCVAAGAAYAADPAKFYGKFKGEVTTTASAKPADVGSKRESTVDIKAAPEAGFLVYWSTEFLARPAGPDKVRATSLHFLPTSNPNVWRAARTGDPLYGQALIWAQVLDKSLTIYATIVPKDGRPVMTIYRRTLNGEDLALEYERIEDGKRTTLVSGTLKKEKS